MILCADDYGLRDDIDFAILELAARRKLSAVSCMVVLERCSQSCLVRLLKLQNQIDIGLHLTLTDERLPLSPTSRASTPTFQPFPSYSEILRAALRGKIEPQQIARQAAAQYELFEEKCGRGPDFIDGHLHVHQLPGIREGLLMFLSSLSLDCRPYVRNTGTSLLEIWQRRLPWMKTAAIGFFGKRMEKQLRRQGTRTNDGFAGIYDFRNWCKYGDYLPRFIASLSQPNGILVVHPGKDETWRQQEFNALGDFNFPDGTPNRFRPRCSNAQQGMQ
jgi:chitin disaccharide deacetylase